MSASRKPSPDAFSEEGETGYRFSREDVSGLTLFARPEKRRFLQKGTMIYMEKAGTVRMEPALQFLQKVFRAGLPPEGHIICERDKHASMQTVICRNRNRGDTLQLEVDTECIFRDTQTGHVFPAGNAKIVFRMHDQKVEGKWGYEFDSVQTDSPVVAAFFSNDQSCRQWAINEIREHLAVPGSGFRHTG